MLKEALNKLVENGDGERAVVRFLSKHPEIVRWAFCNTGGHTTYVVKEFPFGSRYKADFVIPLSYSGGWDVHLIELEPPNDPVINKDGTPSRRFNRAISQMNDWDEYLKTNQASFRKDLSDWCFRKDLLGECKSDRKPCNFTSNYLHDPETSIWFEYHIVIGRRDLISQEKRRKMNQYGGRMNIKICTYGRFLDIAGNIDKRTKNPNTSGALTDTQE